MKKPARPRNDPNVAAKQLLDKITGVDPDKKAKKSHEIKKASKGKKK